MKLLKASLGCFVASGLLFCACGVEPASICDAPLTCNGSSAEGGVEGGTEGGADVIAPPNCDLTKAPKESPACVDDSVGVFVSPTGKDGAAGTKSDPLKSIAEAVTKGKPRVYVCEGTYDGAVTIAQPIDIFGGLTCAWSPSDMARAKLAPAKGVALRVTKVSGRVNVDDLDIVGVADANTAGDSAIAALVAESTSVMFRRVNLTAGPGTAGSKGAGRSNYSGAMPTKGGDQNGALGGVGPTCTCTDGTTSTGGNGTAGSGAGVSAGSSVPPVGSPNAGSSNLIMCNDGTAGANGVANSAGIAMTSAGILTASGWDATAPAANAPNGNPAQGGGGGGAKTQSGTSAGGAGGCGGCGGAGGTTGKTGGSSFVLLSFNSGVIFEGGSMATSAGGQGGAGGAGQDGQAGGAIGIGACNGGPGGSGAGGSGGSGGAGGHSVPVAFVGTEPKVTGATLTPAAKGGPGSGGTPGAGPGNPGTPGLSGPEGKAQNSLAL